ncbi:nitrate/nitrite transporter [Chloroflexota bacterium]
MVSERVDRYAGYRWVILGMAWLTQIVMQWSWYLVPSLAYTLFPELGLNQTRFTLLYTAPLIVAIFVSSFGGGFGDRYGVRIAVALGSFTLGIAGLARAFTSDFEEMLVCMLAMGIAMSFIWPNLPKIVSVWFPRNQVGFATGIYVSAQAIGYSMGLLTGPLFISWRIAFLYVGLISLVVAVLWSVVGRSSPKGVIIEKASIVSGALKGIKSRNIWLICLVLFLVRGAFFSFSGNLPNALETVHHISAQEAGTISSLLPWGAVIGTIVFPLFSDRVGMRKPFFYGGAIISAICFYGAWYIAPDIGTYILVFVGGLFFGALVPLVFTLPLEFPEISREHVGGSAGLVNSLGQLGGVVIPLFVISPVIAAGTLEAYSSGFILIMLLLAGIAIPAAFLLETGYRGKT